MWNHKTVQAIPLCTVNAATIRDYYKNLSQDKLNWERKMHTRNNKSGGYTAYD